MEDFRFPEYEFFGNEITHAIAKAHAKAIEIGGIVAFDFNGVLVRVGPESGGQLYRDRIYRDWRRGMVRPSGTWTAGPTPAVMLSTEELAEDKRLFDERQRRSEEHQRQIAAQDRAKKAVLSGALSVAPEFSVRDAAVRESWTSKNTDPYGGRVISYAEDWARLMQLRMSQGHELEAVASELSHVADHDGITGFMYGAAVSYLATCWEHGERLRRWHNKDTQLGDEGDKANESGGVLNPAVLSIG